MTEGGSYGKSTEKEPAQHGPQKWCMEKTTKRKRNRRQKGTRSTSCAECKQQAGKLNEGPCPFRQKRGPSDPRWQLVRHTYGPCSSRPSEEVQRDSCGGGPGSLRHRGQPVRSEGDRFPLQEFSWLCRLRRRRPFERLIPRPRRRDARGGNTRRQSRPAQGLWHRHLLGRRDRLASILRRETFTPKRTCKRERQWQRDGPEGSRPALPDHPPAQARSRTGQGLRHRLLWHQDPPRRHPRTGRELRPVSWPTGPQRTATPCVCQLNSYSLPKQEVVA